MKSDSFHGVVITWERKAWQSQEQIKFINRSSYLTPTLPADLR